MGLLVPCTLASVGRWPPCPMAKCQRRSEEEEQKALQDTWLGFKAVVVDIGDWAEIAFSMGFPTWVFGIVSWLSMQYDSGTDAKL